MGLKHACILLLLGISSMHLSAQQIINASPSDQISLNANFEEGEIQWQQSENSSDWQDIESANTNNFLFTISTIPVYLRARVDFESCDEPSYSELITVLNNNDDTLYWSDPDTWLPNNKPVAGEVVTIPEGTHIILDENTPNLGGLVINGILEFEQMDLELTSEWIAVHGTLQAGSESIPFTNNATITLTDTDTNESHMDMGTRGLMLMGGTLELHGASPEVTWTKINAHAEIGATTLHLIENAGWSVGDEIVVGPTDYFNAGNGASVTQRVSLTAVNGNELTLNTGLNAHRWGLLQYATANGISLTPGNTVESPIPDGEFITPKILDERAPVGNLSRNIVIQSPDDDLWREEGFGVHVMIMPGSTAKLDGVEIKRGGQRGRLRRYPFHWHMLSYSGSETLADAEGQYIRNSTVNSSANRGIVIHGTNGVTVQNNVLYDIRGHAIFTEDAAERRNIIDRNLVLHVRNPSGGSALKIHESGGGNSGSSAFWISNPDNIITNNMVGDCDNFGFWLAFPEQPFGACAQVTHTDGGILAPNRLKFGTFKNNTAHSNRSTGIMLDFVEIDEAGNVDPSKYESTATGRTAEWPYDDRLRFTLEGYSVWKNGAGGIWDRSDWANNFSAVNADNVSTYFAGAGFDGVIERCLAIGTSLNHNMNGTGRPGKYMQGYTTNTPAAFATYHSTFDIKNNIAINFPLGNDPEISSGVFSTDDYYIRGVEKGQIRNENNLIINSHPGYKLKSPGSYYSFAGALWDPHGVWGPAGNYFVYDDDFHTYTLQKTIVAPGSMESGGVSVPGPFYGFEGFVLNNANSEWDDIMGIHVKRFDNNFNEVGTWTLDSSSPGALLWHMRDFVAHPSGIYELVFQDDAPPTAFRVNVENMLESSDVLLLGIELSGSTNASVNFSIDDIHVNYTELSSLEAVMNSGGETFWQDNANDRVWVKLRGGRWQENPWDISWEGTIYEKMRLIIE